ncbi:MAG: hypothetical protein QGI31_10920, partial [Dehalococcoidia bacterium]|nr:hypothetical protein [Dehalococcoidia bacterium]
ALFRVLTSELDTDWFKGITVLTWFPFDTTNDGGYFMCDEGWCWEFGAKGRAFRGKPAEQTIVDWYHGLNG